MTSREYTITQANSFAVDFFVKGDIEHYGTSTWYQFDKATKEIERQVGEAEVC